MRSSARVEQTRQGLRDLKTEFQQWLDRRDKADTLKRHGQQLAAVQEVVEISLGAIDESLPAASSLPVREVYEECRLAEHRGAFVRRLWNYFSERWDQRDDSSLGPVLAAADEVIWSCYQPPFRHLDIAAGPAPLAHLTPEFSAHAVGRDHAPPALRESDQLLASTVAKLPVPLIGLPYSCVSGPWWLVLVAHEVGHQVAYAIDERSEGPVVTELVAGGAQKAGASPALQRRWKGWSHEVFADAYAAATVGTAHLWALVELEQGSDETMVRELPTYPPPLIRHELVARVIERLGLPADAAVPPPPPALDPGGLAVSPRDKARIAELLELVPAIADALVGTKVMGDAALPALTRWEAALLGGDEGAGWWREQFRRDQATPEEGLESARLASVGALAAWAEIAEESEPELRHERAEALRERILAVLPASREEGYRAEAPAAELDVGALGRETAAAILRLPPEEALGTATVTG